MPRNGARARPARPQQRRRASARDRGEALGEQPSGAFGVAAHGDGTRQCRSCCTPIGVAVGQMRGASCVTELRSARLRQSSSTTRRPGLIVLQADAPPCKPRHRRDEAEAEARTRAGCGSSSRRTKRFSTRSRSSDGMPGPRSATMIRRHSAPIATGRECEALPRLRRSPPRILDARCRRGWRRPGRSARDWPRTRGRRRASIASAQPRLLGDRLVKLGHVRDDRGRDRTLAMSLGAAPASSRAISSSALKVLISSSAFSIVLTERLRDSPRRRARRAAPPRRGCAAG